MSKLKELYAKKQQVVAQMRDNAPKDGAEWTEERKAAFNKADTDLIALDDQIKAEERLKKLEVEETELRGKSENTDKPEVRAELNASNSEKRSVFEKAKRGEVLTENEKSIHEGNEKYSRAFEKWVRNGIEELSAEERSILKTGKEKESRAQSTTTTAGGYTVPQGFGGRIIESMAMISQLMNWATILRTDTGNDIPFPTNDDTANVGELIGENSDLSSSSADLVFGQKTLQAFKISSKLIKVSNELLQDNAVNLESYLGGQLANRVARTSNTYWTTGAGTTEPSGYATDTIGASEGADSGATLTLTAQTLIDLMHSVDPAYRSSPKCAWSFHDLILAYIKKLAVGSSDDRPLWLPSIREGEPDTLYGKPYFVNQAQASTINTGNKPVFFGDWSQYYIRIVNDFALRRLTERYAEFDQVAFFGLMRMDGLLMNTSAIKYMDSAT